MPLKKRKPVKIGDLFGIRNPRGVYIYYQVTNIFITKNKKTRRKEITYEMNGNLKVSQDHLEKRFERYKE